jgi:S-adenosyl-L-methionine hydrolase (adenosine-forming)
VAKPIVFLSDYGLDDEFVGICHGVIARISPDSRIIDLTHGIPPHDVLRGAIVLAQSMLYMPKESVFLAVVDPGVGTERRSIAVRDEAGFVTVGPDNGLLSMSWVGGAAQAAQISSPETILTPTSPTFHGRDVFAPAAAHLSRGADLADLGPEVPVGSLVRLTVPRPDVDEDGLLSRVIGVDRFGNIQLSAKPEDLAELQAAEASELVASIEGKDWPVRRVGTFGLLEPGEDGLIVDSAGSLAIVRRDGSAAEAMELGLGDDVLLRRPSDRAEPLRRVIT